MKVNLHQAFVDIYGNPVIDEKGEKRMIDETVCLSLFSGSFLRPSNDPDENIKNKLDAHRLCMKISHAQGEVDLTSEECTLVKKAASTLNPGGFGQVYDLIEKQ